MNIEKKIKISKPETKRGFRFGEKLLPQELESVIMKKYLIGSECHLATKHGKLCDRQFWFTEITPSPLESATELKDEKVVKLDCSRFCVDRDAVKWITYLWENVPKIANIQVRNNIYNLPIENWSMYFFINIDEKSQLLIKMKPKWSEMDEDDESETEELQIPIKGIIDLETYAIEGTTSHTVLAKPAIQWLANLCQKCAFKVHIELNVDSYHFPKNVVDHRLISFDDNQKYFGKNADWTMKFYNGRLFYLSLIFSVPASEKTFKIPQDFATQIEKFKAEGY
jgi:hypothetical protein